MTVAKVGQVKQTLSKAMKDICNPEKTRDMKLVNSNLDCEGKDPLRYAQQFMEQQQDMSIGRNGRRDSVLAHRIIQSFDPDDDITAQQAHELGVRLMTELTDDDQYFVIATYVDWHHIHNHIMLSPILISQSGELAGPS